MCQMDGTGKPYEEAATMGDCLNAILNLDSVMRQLWPHDYTSHILLRTAVKYDFFSAEKTHKRRLAIFEQFFNGVSWNSCCHRPGSNCLTCLGA